VSNYNKQIYFKTGSDCDFPIDPHWEKEDIYFYRYFKQYYEDLTSLLKFEGSRLKFPRIEEEGEYVLKILPIYTTVQITFIKNNLLETDAL
jgi:hypothetical protein